MKNILITGGAGFIGAHVANELLCHGYRVRALEVLSPQVHAPGQQRPSYLNRDIERLWEISGTDGGGTRSRPD